MEKVHISFPWTIGKLQSVFIGETRSYPISIENLSAQPIPLPEMYILCSKPAGSFDLSLMEPPSSDSDTDYIQKFLEGFSLDDTVIPPHTSINVWLTCIPKEIGMHTFILHIDIGANRVEECIIFLLAEEKNSPILFLRKPRFLPYFDIPNNTRMMLENGYIPNLVTGFLTNNNYSAYFTALINMEELHLENEMRKYDMDSISILRRGSKSFAVEVFGVAERRPSLARGDLVMVKLSNGSNSVFKGYIYSIEADAVVFSLNKRFQKQYQQVSLYTVRFAPNRLNVRRLYQAVKAAQSLDPCFLFPSKFTPRLNGNMNFSTMYSTNLNEEQNRSVSMILRCQGGPPYVIYGPPGTGKTKTVVEAILQVYRTRKDARILVCAASNSAADDVLERIIRSETVKVKDHEIFRLNAKSRKFEDVRINNASFCYFEDDAFECPPIQALMCYKVIICTYISSSYIYAQGINRGHFSHIFLDEAGQVSEPDAMVPLSNLCEKETVVVLAGDPKQLGSVIISTDAVKYGLGKSYLERLFEFTPYQNRDANFVTKLVKNYRSHPAILELPSRLFYEGELIACKNDASSRKKNWLNILPNKEFPLLFIGIQGYDEQESNDPSWFNRIEVNKVVELVKRLRNRSSGLLEKEIGVISPYHQQVIKITKAFERLGIYEVKVGSVEQFQGQEREVIIVSTVRSVRKHKKDERINSLGFLSNPRRFNVAVTRARSLLIIVGDPHILQKDKHWRKLLWYCCNNGSYQGCALPERRS